MSFVPLVIHERRAVWTRQLRGRGASWPLRIIETRGAADLSAALRQHDFALGVIDLANRPMAALEEFAAAMRSACDPLVLVLDPANIPEAARLARELGATEVWSGFVAPPRLVAKLESWMELAQRRRAAERLCEELLPASEDIADLSLDTIIQLTATP